MNLAYGWKLPDGQSQEIWLDEATRRRGIYALGLPNSGKTSLMRHCIRVDMETGDSFTCIDVEESFDLPVPRFDPTRGVTPFNLLRSRESVEHLTTAFSRHFGQGFLDRAQDVFRHCCLLLLERGLTLADLPRLLSDERYRTGLVRRTQNESVELFFRHVDSLGKRQWAFQSEAVRNKVAQFCLHPLIKPCLATRDCIPIEGQLLASFPERIFADNAGLLGAMLVSHIYETALGRPHGSQLHTTYIDEVQLSATELLVELSMRGRKRGHAICVGHQVLQQPPFDKNPGLLAAIHGATGTMCLFAMSWPDACYFASHVLPGTGAEVKIGSDHEPQAFWAVSEFDRQMASILHNQQQGELFVRIRGVGTFEAVTYDVSDIPEPQNVPYVSPLLPPAPPEPPEQDNEAGEDDGEYLGDPNG